MSGEKELHAKFEELRRELCRLGLDSVPLPEAYTLRDRMLLSLVMRAPADVDSLEALAWIFNLFFNTYPLTSEFELLSEEDQEVFLNSVKLKQNAINIMVKEHHRRKTLSRMKQP